MILLYTLQSVSEYIDNSNNMYVHDLTYFWWGLFAETVSGTKVMLTLVFGTETVSANKFLFAETVPANKHFADFLQLI